MDNNYNYSRPARRFSETFKRKVIEYYLSHKESKREVWERFTEDKQEHGQIIKWLRKYDYLPQESKQNVRFVGMTEKEISKKPVGLDLDQMILTDRVKELERRLKDAELQAIAYSKMIDIAEKELKISIRKKYNTKP